MLALGDLAPQRLGRHDELSREVLQTLDLLAVALAHVLEVRGQALHRGGRLRLAQAPASVRRRQAPQRTAGKLARAAPRACQGPADTDLRFHLIVDGHRRSFDYRPMSLASARLL